MVEEAPAPAPKAAPAPAIAKADDDGEKGAEVVSLDKFRKK